MRSTPFRPLAVAIALVAAAAAPSRQIDADTAASSTAGVDLLISTVAVPASLSPGGAFEITDVVRNAGSADSTSSVTRYYFSRDASKNSGDVRSTGSRSIPPLPAASELAGTAKLTAPSSLATGSYFLLACADDTRIVAEDNENNNCMATASMVTVMLGDLVTEAVSAPPAIAMPGSKFTVTTGVHNPSAVTVAASTSRFYLSYNVVRDAGDVLLTGSLSVAGPAAGATSTGAKSVTIPAAVAEGTYWLLACADDTAAVRETNEANNCTASAATMVVGRPDLRTTAVSNPPAVIRPGRSFSVTDTVYNGGAAAASSSTTRYYISADASRGAGDLLLGGTRSISSLAPASAATGSKSVTVPSAAPVGLYYLLACADDRLVVPESNETNNCLASSTLVRVALPDLSLDTLSDPPAYAWPGRTFTIDTTVVNGGLATAPSSTIRFYVSGDVAKDAGDIRLTPTRVVGELMPGQASTGSTTLTLPAELAHGTYMLLACANDLATFVETSAANNCRASAAFRVGRANVRPRAHAGLDADTMTGAVFTLDGSGSTDADGDELSYRWTLLTRPAASQAVLSEASAAAPTFTIDAPGQYVVQLFVDDGMEPSDADIVTITTGAVRFAALGDTGTGDAGQYAGAAALQAKCARSGCDFVALLGDNIYSSGVTSVSDPQFNTKFEQPYAQIDVPFYVVLGNHDYGGGGIGNEFYKGQFQVDYTAVSSKWRMPGAYYSVVSGEIELFGLDTNMQLYGLDQQQRADVGDWLDRSTAAWKIALGHHPYRSNGAHGNAGSYHSKEGVPDGAGIKAFMEDIVCGRADLLLSGHDHNLQWLAPDGTCAGTELIVSGAGSSPRALKNPSEAGYNPTYFQAPRLGFVYLIVTAEQLTAQFVGENGEHLYVRTISR
jgi:subtilase family serine protease